MRLYLRGLSFLDELKEGAMVHARSVFPHETVSRDTTCQLNATDTCLIGFACPASTPYDDKLLDKNLFVDEDGKYCNCWLNEHVEHWLIPRLEKAVREVG